MSTKQLILHSDNTFTRVCGPEEDAHLDTMVKKAAGKSRKRQAAKKAAATTKTQAEEFVDPRTAVAKKNETGASHSRSTAGKSGKKRHAVPRPILPPVQAAPHAQKTPKQADFADSLLHAIPRAPSGAWKQKPDLTQSSAPEGKAQTPSAPAGKAQAPAASSFTKPKKVKKACKTPVPLQSSVVQRTPTVADFADSLLYAIPKSPKGAWKQKPTLKPSPTPESKAETPSASAAGKAQPPPASGFTKPKAVRKRRKTPAPLRPSAVVQKTPAVADFAESLLHAVPRTPRGVWGKKKKTHSKHEQVRQLFGDAPHVSRDQIPELFETRILLQSKAMLKAFA